MLLVAGADGLVIGMSNRLIDAGAGAAAEDVEEGAVVDRKLNPEPGPPGVGVAACTVGFAAVVELFTLIFWNILCRPALPWPPDTGFECDAGAAGRDDAAPAKESNKLGVAAAVGIISLPKSRRLISAAVRCVDAGGGGDNVPVVPSKSPSWVATP